MVCMGKAASQSGAGWGGEGGVAGSGWAMGRQGNSRNGQGLLTVVRRRGRAGNQSIQKEAKRPHTRLFQSPQCEGGLGLESTRLQHTRRQCAGRECHNKAGRQACTIHWVAEECKSNPKGMVAGGRCSWACMGSVAQG